MKKKRNHVVLILLSIFIIVILLTFGADYYIENKIESTLKKELSEDFVIDDFELNVNSISGNVFVESLSIKKKNDPLTHVNIADFDLKGLSVYQLVFKNNIIIDKLEIDKLRLSVDENSELLKKDTTSSKQSQMKMNNIELKEFSIDSLNIQLVSSTSKPASFKVKNMTLNISDLKLNQDSKSEILPFQFEKFSLKQGKLTYMMGEFNELSINEIAYQNKNIEINDLSFQTIYGKEEFSEQIETEKDHYSLSIPTVKLLNFEAEKNNNVKHIKSSKLVIDQPDLEVYRDKQVANDTTFKALYSRKLRKLPFQLTIDSSEIKNAQIKYEEKTKKDKAPGKINFKNLNVSIAHLSNTYDSEAKNTNIKIDGIFMKKTPLDAEWSFDVNNERDEFTFKAELGFLAADNFNNFTENSLKVLLEGELEKTYLNIHGNNNSSTTNMILTYDDLKVTFLNKKGEQKKILSGIVNFFVSDDNKNKDKDNKTLKANAQRDKQKSFFNFLWVSISTTLKEMLKL